MYYYYIIIIYLFVYTDYVAIPKIGVINRPTD